MKCNYPNSGLYISSMGNVSPCCAIIHGITFENVDQFYSNNFFTSIRENNNNNKILDHPACKTCKINLDNSQISQLDRSKKILKETSDVKIRRLDIAFSNTCNLDCVMCTNFYSSKWNKVIESMPEEIQKFTNKSTGMYFSMSYEQIDNIIESCGSSLESIIIKGGEPFYDKKTIYFLDKLSDINPNVRLSIVSNCTIINEDILKKFKNLYVVASVDGIFEIYEYVRGFNFSEVEENIDRIMSYKKGLVLNFTASAYNFAIWPKFYKYFKNKGINSVIQFANEKYLTASHLGETIFQETVAKSPIKINPTFQQLTEQDKNNFKTYTKFMNKWRDMKWKEIDVSRY
tara:strand:+ start:2945 stop:3979 length:1035 start_codon:yes stop_codon:yes gene_type:complete